MIPIYVNRVRVCQTLNQLNAAHIGLERLITPAELIELWQTGFVEDGLCEATAVVNPNFERPEYRANVRAWLERTKTFHDLARKAEIEPFLRREIARSLTLFYGPGERAEKTLLLCFNGVANAPMMPPVTLLQVLDARRVDIAMLKDIPFRGFCQGMVDIGDSLEAVIAALPGLLTIGAYRQVCVLGISGGALASLFVAQRLHLRSVLMCGSRGLDDKRWDRGDGVSIAQWITAGRQLAPDLRVVVTHGKGYERDERPANELAPLLGITPRVISSPHEEIGHNTLFPQLKDGRLGAFLVETLGL